MAFWCSELVFQNESTLIRVDPELCQSSVKYNLPNLSSDDIFAMVNGRQVLTGKTLLSDSNTIEATSLRGLTLPGTSPSAGQVLVASSDSSLKWETLSIPSQVDGRVSTDDDDSTELLTLTVESDTIYYVDTIVTAVSSDDTKVVKMSSAFRSSDKSNVNKIGNDIVQVYNSGLGTLLWDVDITTTNSDIVIKVTGIDSKTINWSGHCQYKEFAI